MKKNITIVVSAMNMGGAQRVVSILSNYWSLNGCNVTLICTLTGKRIMHYQIDKNVKIIYLKKIPFLSKINTFNLVWKLYNLRRIIKSQAPDIVISFLARTNLATAIAAKGLKSPLIMCERTWPPFSSLNNKLLWLYRILFKSADKIIVQTEKSKTWLNQNFSFNNVRVIPNPSVFPVPLGSEKTVHPNSIISQNKKVILACGRLHKYKQFDLLIKAFFKLKDKHLDWNLVILGAGEERETLNLMAINFGLHDRVYFPGSIGNMSEWYERADLFVLSSIVEGFPNVLLEAMTYGLPCISFDCDTGPRDMIQDGENGILVNPDNKESGLSKAMDKIISNQELRYKIANKSILVREKYSINSIVEKWNNILNV